MAFSVENLSELERKITVVVASEAIEAEVASKLKKLAQNAKIPGFRPGKVPMNVLKQRYEDSVRQEVARDIIRPSLIEALQEASIVPASYPEIIPNELKPGEDFSYSAIFEVFPEINITSLNPEEDEVEIISAEVAETDIDVLLEDLRSRRKEWVEVSRPAKLEDQLLVDFEGFIADEAFEGNSAESYEIVLGSGALIPGFEDGLVGAEAGQKVSVNVNFPATYHKHDLADKAARFDVVVHSVKEGVLPALDESFVAQFNVADGTLESLRTELRDNMMRELERKVSARNRENIFDAFLRKNPIALPQSLVNEEIESLKHQMYHQVFGHEHHENEKIPDFPRELFEEKAMRRVHLGLLFSEYVKKHEILTDRARVDALVEKLAQAYEDPEELRAYYRGNKENLVELETMVLEEMVSESMMKDARLVFKKLNYADVMHAKNQNDD